MLVAVFLLLIWHADGAYRCADNANTSMSFRPSTDGVKGRYTAELCTLKNPNVSQWKLDLSFYDNPKFCQRSIPGRVVKPGQAHSTNIVDINDGLNCSHVCFSMNFDLIFGSCYAIKSTMMIGDKGLIPYDTYHIISNNLTIKHFMENKPHVKWFNHDDGVSLTWYLGLPPTEYKVLLCEVRNKTDKYQDYNSETMDVSHNCSADAARYSLHCLLELPLGCYRMWVQHEAAWTAGMLHGRTYAYYNFCHNEAKSPLVSGSGAGVWWACGGALLAVGALLAAGLARRALHRCAYHKRVLETWRRQRLESETVPVIQDLGNKPILLLYAREGDRGQRAADLLRELLQESVDGKVYDLFSPEVVALAAPAPYEWVRAALRRHDVRVLLLQTPALAALYGAPPDAAAPQLRPGAPLLGRRVLYRAPQFGDALLLYALRLVAETAPDHHAYHKFYLATLSELPTDVLPSVVPYRRYALPGALPVLLRDVAPGAEPSAQLAERFELAAGQLAQHAADNPDYLRDELLLL